MIGFKVGLGWFEIGNSDFLHSFFSTVCYNLEGGNWGSKYPVIMGELYRGNLNYKFAPQGMRELTEIKLRFKEFSPSKVVWDIENLSKQPPWGDNISSDITDLSNYFVTCNGVDFIDVLHEAINLSIKEKKDLNIISI